MPIDVTHPIFHSFFEMKRIDFPHPLVDVIPSYFALFEDNDPTQRMLALANYNNDLAEYLGVVVHRHVSRGHDERGLQARRQLHHLRHDALTFRRFKQMSRNGIISGLRRLRGRHFLSVFFLAVFRETNPRNPRNPLMIPSAKYVRRLGFIPRR